MYSEPRDPPCEGLQEYLILHVVFCTVNLVTHPVRDYRSTWSCMLYFVQWTSWPTLWGITGVSDLACCILYSEPRDPPCEGLQEYLILHVVFCTVNLVTHPVRDYRSIWSCMLYFVQWASWPTRHLTKEEDRENNTNSDKETKSLKAGAKYQFCLSKQWNYPSLA